ncbi:MAG: hypothetical protein Kow0059_14140 [Candidatus Sumerlaeia bacterium]
MAAFDIQHRRQAEDREFFEWLSGIEKRAIIPLKWAILLISLIIWLWSTGWVLPATPVFMMFFLYMMFNLAQSYFFYLNRVSPAQIKPFCYVSYLVDILFVTALMYFDAQLGRTDFQSDYYVFYFLLILRGFGIFRSPKENIFISLIISVLFVFSINLQPRSVQVLGDRLFYFRFFMIWVVTFMAWFIVDIINRQKTELIGVRERLLRAEHLANVGELSATLAHEINNPMGIISAYSEFLMRKLPEGSEQREDLEVIVKETQRCKHILKELMDYSKPTMEEVKKVDLTRLNDEVLALLFASEKDSRFEVQKFYDAGTPLVLGDGGQIKQALINLYMNARQAMPDGGMIRVRVGHESGDAGQVVVEIEDSGCGIPRDLIKKIFDPFVTGRKDGTGLGLYITRQIMEAHRGRISIESKKDHGTLVRLTFPAA